MPFPDTIVEEPPSSTVATPPPLPARIARPVPAIDFYKIDCRKLRLAEWMRSTGLATALIGWGLGRIGGNITSGQRAPILRDWSDAEISEDQLPDDVRKKFADANAQLFAAGFCGPVFYRVVNRFNGYEDWAALLIGPSAKTLARVLWSRALPGGRIRERFETAFLTMFEDGRGVMTRDCPLRFDLPPEIRAQHRAQIAVADLARLHEETVTASANDAPHQLVRAREDLWSVYTAYETADFRFHEKRRLFTAPSSEESASDREVAQAEHTAAAQGSRFGAAWAELQVLQTKKPSVINGLWLLAITILVSAKVGFGGATGKSLAIIIGVLFFHELGHYLAMRVFKYRNVKMFFLPGFGAAVTGKHYNVPGWKKAMVSLLGPVPGIWCGAVLGGVALFSGNDLLAEIALILVALNVFNLLPIVPLDGGWFWNSVLFSRAPWLELAFKGFAGLSGIGASAAGAGRIWMFLGIATLLALPAALIQGKVATGLRRRGFTPSADDDDSVPFQTAETIFGELETLGKGKFNTKTLATHAVQVFERLNATPPNWLETLGLSAVYFASIAAAIISLGVVSVFHFDPAKLDEAAAESEKKPAPAPTLDARYNGEFHHQSATQTDEKSGTRFLIAQFPSSDDAQRAYAQLAAAPAPTVDLAHFGQSVLVQVPAKKNNPAKKFADTLAQAGGTVSDDGDRKGWFTLNLAATAPSPVIAAQLHHSLDVWLNLPNDLRPPAPWTGESDPSIQRAGETWLKIQDVKNQASQSPEVRRRERQSFLTAIFHRGKNGFSQNRDAAAARDQAQRAAVERLRATHDPAMDDDVLAHELQRPPFSLTDRNPLNKWRADLRQLVTQQVSSPAKALAEAPEDADADEEDDAMEDGNWRDNVRGNIELARLTITLKNLHFGTPARDFPALADWLVARGCTGLRYGVQKCAPADFSGE